MRTFRLAGGTELSSNVEGFDPKAAMERLRAIPADLREKVLLGSMTFEEAEALK